MDNFENDLEVCDVCGFEDPCACKWPSKSSDEVGDIKKKDRRKQLLPPPNRSELNHQAETEKSRLRLKALTDKSGISPDRLETEIAKRKETFPSARDWWILENIIDDISQGNWPPEVSRARSPGKLAISGAIALATLGGVGAGAPYVFKNNYRRGVSGTSMRRVGQTEDGDDILSDRSGKKYVRDKKGTIRRLRY